MRVEISKIKVEERQRKLVSNIDKLAISINKYGLFNAIVVEEVEEGEFRFRLVQGFRRIEAHKLLKLSEIEVKLRKNLNELERKELELEENIQREQYTWDEECDARRDLDTIKRRLYGSAIYQEEGWGVKDTAEALGESVRQVQYDIMLSKAMEVMPELRKSKNKAEAMKVLKSERNKMVREQLVAKAEALLSSETEPLVKVIEGDCLKVMREMSGEIFHLAISDPPFGKALHHAVSAVETQVMVYKDNSPKDNKQLYIESVQLISRLLKPNSHFYMFFPLDEDYRFYLDLLRANFDFVDDTPLVWIKGRGGYTTNIAFNRGVGYQMRYLPQYQPIFFAAKGVGRRLTREMSNVLEVESVKHKEHIAEAPVELFKILIEQSTIVGESVLDPFCGSGNSLVAAKELRRKGLGIEIGHDNCNLIKSKIYE